MSDTLEIKSSVKLYNSIENISAWSWYKILGTGDLRYSIDGFEGEFLNSDIKKYKTLLDYVEQRRIDREERERELMVSLLESDYLEAIKPFRQIMTQEIKDKIEELGFTNHDILKESSTPELMQNWLELEQQHLDEFGTSDELRNRNRIKRKLKDLNIKFILSGKNGGARDRSLLNLIKIEEGNLEVGKQEHFSIYQVLNSITKHQGVNYDPKKTPIIQWDYILKDMAKHGNAKG